MPDVATAFTDNAPADRYCDLVMKGGITSGVSYPLAACELAQAYRLHCIGGSSAGAIAAAVTAAAEFRRRNGSGQGFDRLAGLPAQLGEDVGGRPRLQSLFQPQPGTRRLFKALLAALNRPTTGSRWWGAVQGLLGAYALHAIAGAFVGAWLGWRGGALLLGLVVLVAVAAAALAGVLRDVAVGLVPNGFGLCKGGPGGGAPALLPWLHGVIQDTAGLQLDRPLTFKQLHEAPGYPPLWLQGAEPDPKSIDLQLFTTNLAHGRPYLLPLKDQTSRLFFKAEELADYFPTDVMDALLRAARPYAPASDADPAPADAEPDLLELPGAELPVLVAVRLSLSFPFLISAVPLWAVDYRPRRGERKLRRCWFSDGGISSNFPIHLFDSFVPLWPTFGITLVDGAARKEPVWLPRKHLQGRGDSWLGTNDKDSPWRRLGAFVTAIFDAAQNWNDATATRMPGVRERVVRVFLRPRLGGLNLAMPAGDISELAGLGRQAGRALVERFAAPVAGAPAVGWSEHRWLRFNIMLVALRERLRRFVVASRSAPYATPLRVQIAQACQAAPLAGTGERALSQEEAAALESLLDALDGLQHAFERANVAQPYNPLPTPQLRVRPPL